MTPDALTVEQVREGLAAHGIRLDERDSQCSCPVCDGLMALTVTVNGAGAHVECSAGCHAEAILGVVRVGRRMAERGAGHDALQLVRNRLAQPGLERIVKRGKLGDSYELRMADGQVIELGNATTLQSQPKFRARYMPQARDLPPRIKNADEWDAFVLAIETAAEELDNVASEAEETRAWLGAWLQQTRYPTIAPGDTATLYEMLGSPPPAFATDGTTYIRLAVLAAWVNRFGGARVTGRELSARLATLEFSRSQPSARQGSDVRKARYWASPRGFEADE